MTEGSREASILFGVCYYGFGIALAIAIFRGLRIFFRAHPSQDTLCDSNKIGRVSDGQKKAPINYIWPFIGLGLGTTIAGSLVLSVDALERLSGGLLFGGVPLGLLGLLYAVYRRNRGRLTTGRPDR